MRSLGEGGKRGRETLETPDNVMRYTVRLQSLESSRTLAIHVNRRLETRLTLYTAHMTPLKALFTIDRREATQQVLIVPDLDSGAQNSSTVVDVVVTIPKSTTNV